MELTPFEMRMIVQALIVLILSVAVHEFGHAYVAHRLGDRLPESQGRVTLNPMAHADPIGTGLVPVVFLIMSKGMSIGFGWGKPVMVNPLAFSRTFQMRVAHMMVALAGPVMNIIFGTLIGITHAILISTGTVEPYSTLSIAIEAAVLLNFVLFFFNLIPAHPLDGNAVLKGLVPREWLPKLEPLERYGIFILFAVVMIPQLQTLFVTPAYWLHDVLYSTLGLETLWKR